MIRKKLLKRGLTVSLSAFVAMSSLPLASTVAMAESAKTTWAELYQGMGVDTSTGYDAVTSATGIAPNPHYQHIPGVVNKDEYQGKLTDDAEETTTLARLDGVNLQNIEDTVETRLQKAEFTTTTKYGSAEFLIYPDDTAEGYTWNEYLDHLYAVTISDGTTKVGALPWVDFYGEKATSGKHYNNVEIALNSGISAGDNKAEVHRYDAFYQEDGSLKQGIYTISVYSEGYKTLTAKVSTGALSVEDTTSDAKTIRVSGSDSLGFTPSYLLDGKEVSCTDGEIAVEGLTGGTHTLTAADTAGEVASVSTTFTVKSETLPVQANYNGSAIFENGEGEKAFAAYIANIQSVEVNGNEYLPTGRKAVKLVKEDGSLDLTQDALKDLTEADVVIKSNGFPDLSFKYQASEERYAVMNVPYRDFYAAYELTDAAVWEVESGLDAVSTATTSKYLGTDGLAKGSYNNGTYIMGVALPVKMTRDVYETLKTRAAGTDYAITEVAEIPKACSEVTESGEGYSFSKLGNAEINTSFLSVKDLEMNAGYGDYQITLGGFSTNREEGIRIGENDYEKNYTIYGAVLNTTDGKKYGMTVLENLWFGNRVPEVEIAWSVKGGQGLKRGHGRGGEFYQFDMNGAALESVTVITNVGVIEIPCSGGSLELPAYYAGDTSTLKTVAAGGSDEVSITGVPEAFGVNPKVTISYKSGKSNVYLAEEAPIENGKVKLSAAVQDGTNYTLILEGNGNAIIRALISEISGAQKTELENLIQEAEKTEGYNENADLKEHVQEAKDLLAKEDANSSEAEKAAKAAEENKKAADAVIAKIKALPAKATAASEKAVTAARTAYNGLTAAQKKLVTNLSKLTTAESQVKAAKMLQQETKAAQAVKVSIKKVTAAGRALTVSWKKASKITGYQIQAATNSKFTKGKKTVTVKKASATSQKITKLKKKKKYYVRVRSYKTISGKSVYGKWSKVLNKKTK